jgi:mRNA interferase MazF
MKRGDLITVAVSGDYGKPRPALVIQTGHLPETDSVLVCLLTTTIRDAPLFRFPLPAAEGTELAQPSQVMVDKIMAVRRARCGARIGKLDPGRHARAQSIIDLRGGCCRLRNSGRL